MEEEDRLEVWSQITGGYPWTHLYKEPLGPDDEPEVIFRYRSSPKNRRSFEEKLLDSPKSEKRVRIDTEVSVQDCCYPDILDDDDDPHVTESNASEDVAEHTEHTEPSKEESVQPQRRSFRQIFSPKSILKRSVKSDRAKQSPAKQSPAKKEPDTSPNRVRYCHPIVDKLKTMAEKQLSKTQGKKVKKIPLQESNKISLEEEQKILKLKDSPKAKHREITCFEERQDSDDIVEIVELDESPGEARRRRDEKKDSTSHVTPDEIIELPVQSSDVELKNEPKVEPENEPKDDKESSEDHTEEPKKKIPRRQEHVYEDIQAPVILTGDSMDPSLLHDIIAPTDLKTSLKIQDKQLFAEVEYKRKPLEDITQSSEESQKSTTGLLAPICSVDSASSDDERKATLQAVVEENTATDVELKSVLKTEASPSLDKRVTFSSSTEDDPDLLKEDVELAGLDANLSSRWSNMSPPSTSMIATVARDRDLFGGMKYGEGYTMSRSSSQDRPSSVRSSVDRFPSAGKIMKTVSFDSDKSGGIRDSDQVIGQVKFQLHNRAALGLDRNYDIRDHEYEPIGQPVDEAARADTEDVELEGAVGGQESPVAEPSKRPASEASSITSHERKLLRVPTEEEGADDEMSVQDIQKDIEDRYFTSATPESRTDGELHTSAVDSSAIEDLPLDRGSRKKTMLTSAQDRGRQMQQKLRTQAGKLRSKLRGMKKAPNGKKDSHLRRKERSYKAPEFTKLKNIHMPKVNKPEMPKFKRPEFTKIEFKKPDFSKITLPERPSMSKLRIPERFSSLKLRRSRSMKESTGSTGDSTSGTNEPPAATKKRFDFATYPRIFDKMRKQKTVDGEKPVRPGTPPPATFATVAKTAVKKDSLAPEESVGEESADQRQDSLEEEEFHRESSLERRMRQHFMRQREESEQEQALETEEQRQMADFDKENREIHEISLARQEEFKQRPLVHQDSDLVSEESAGKWTGSLNLNQSSSLQGSEKFDFDSNTIPIEVKEPQKGVIEQIDDDEFFLRSKGISQDNIQIGEYISSAIREGLTTPMNTLAQVGDVDLNSEPIDYGYDVPKKPRRVRDRSSLEGEEFFGTYPPTKPMRKHRNYESDERIVPQTGTYYNEGENQSFYDNNMEGMDQPDMYIDDEEEQKSDMQERLPFPPTPPKAPKRRRKLHRPPPRSIPGYDNLAGRSVSNNYIPNGDTDENIIVYRTQHEYPVPLATPETFTPIPTPRSRSRSQTSRITDDDRTSHGAESLISDTHMQIQEFLRNELEITGNNGYAVVKKEPPPRPPPPRRKKTSKALGESQFATMPLPKRSVTPPTRPKRNYSTIAPSRPPRTKSTSSLGEDKPYRRPSPDLTQYEEIDDVDSHKDLQSGDIIKKMKERPLPPPPRPTRSLRRPKKDNKDDKPDDDRDGGGIRDAALNADEVEVSTQTDPLPDDFCCEEFEITSDMKTITPSQCKTLEDILKEEQEAEIERAQQLAAEQSLTRGLQRFREGNHRSLSERSKASTLDRPKTPGSRPGSRPISPNAVVVERKISTPTMLTEATLSVEPVDEPTTAELSREIQGILSQELQPVQPEMREESEVRTEILSDVASDRASIGQEEERLEIKEPPPRPPPPRRKKTSKALGESQFATMPLPKRSVTPPTRPKRNYSTIAPSRPPRTKSTSSLGEDKPYRSPSPDLTQYEEIDDVDSHKDLQSGDIIKKMKERPLPPPPRPTRSLRRPKKDNKDDKPDDDRDGGGIRDAALNADEVEVSTQTDPLPDDFCCEEFEITSDMKTITPSQCKTLEDILKEEQEAEIERAQQLAAEQSLTRGLQRFREGITGASTLDRPKTPGSRPGSRPISPNAVVVERKISTPTMLTEATLSVEPVDEPTTAELSREIQGILSQELQPVQPEMREESEVRTEILSDVASDRASIGQEEERLEIVDAIIEQRVPEPSQEVQEVQEDVPEEVQPSQEEITRRMHDEVEAELERCAQRLEQVIDVLQQEDIPPVPPPRRKSSAGDSLIPQTSSGNLQLRDLTVDHLNVNQLQAGKLLVSELEGSSLSTQELECKSGNLVVKSLELPKGLIEEIVDRVRSQLPAAPPPPTTTTTVHEDPELEKEPPPPTRPPPPHGYYHLPTEFYPYSLPPPSFYRLRNPSDEDEEPPSTSHRRRRHHRAHRDSSEEEEHVREPRNRSRHSSRTPDVIDLGGQFLRACSSAAGRSVRQTLQLVRAMVVKEENRNEVNVVAMLLIVLMASLVLICMGGSDKTVHHHHWDFFNAPGNGNLPK
uniref:Uncharacterized protein n=1 Tax=Lutzomyia longipalpis TaxID=7200 RepID=A0A1B0GGX9_LUTLO